MIKKILFFFVILLIAYPVTAQVPVEVHPNQKELLESDDPQLAVNKKLVYDFWIEVFQTRNMELAPKYMAEDYIQHNPTVATGRQPFMDFFGQFEQQPKQDYIPDLVYIMAEDDMVVLAFKREYPDPDNPGETYTTTWFDMFRIEDGKMAEHWDYGTK
ncbi:MAG: nuclear transport factor 2 family protein [Balneolaceae bacterium]